MFATRLGGFGHLTRPYPQGTHVTYTGLSPKIAKSHGILMGQLVLLHLVRGYGFVERLHLSLFDSDIIHRAPSAGAHPEATRFDSTVFQRTPQPAPLAFATPAGLTLTVGLRLSPSVWQLWVFTLVPLAWRVTTASTDTFLFLLLESVYITGEDGRKDGTAFYEQQHWPGDGSKKRREGGRGWEGGERLLGR